MIRTLLQNIPALIVTLPIFIAPLIAMIPSASKPARNFIWGIVFASMGLALAGSVYLFCVVYQTGPFSYFFGAWPPPKGIEYEATKLNTLLLILISGLAFMLMPYAKISVEAEISHKKTGLFYAVFLLLVAGLMGMVLTNDIFNIFVFLEISSLATYALVALGQDKRALTASFNYLIVGTIGGTLFLTGIAFLYVLTGSLNISDIAYQLGTMPTNKIEVAAICFIFIGLAIKCGIVPLAGWLPRVYQYSPNFVAAFSAAVSTKVALYLLAKMLYVLFGKTLALEEFALGNLLLVLAVAGIFFGGLAAIFQSDYRRLLAFSSISNIGFILLGIGLGTRFAVAGAIILFISHALAKAGLFVVLGACGNKINGLKKSSPILAAFLVLFGFSLIGVPLTLGFIPKWHLLIAASELGGWKVALTFLGIIGGSVLSAIYVWKMLESAYSNEYSEAITLSKYSLVSLVGLAFATILMGVYAAPMADFVTALAGEFAK